MTTQVSDQAVEKVIFDGVEEIGAEGEITRDAAFEDLDLDSLDLVELAQIVEDDYGVALTTEDLKRIETVGDAVDLVVERTG